MCCIGFIDLLYPCFEWLDFVHLVQVNLPVNVMPVTFPGHGHSQAFNAPDDLPKTVTRTLNQGSSPMSMDFHPVQQALLLGVLLLQIIFNDEILAHDLFS